jgi:hypothetical protein
MEAWREGKRENLVERGGDGDGLAGSSGGELSGHGG